MRFLFLAICFNITFLTLAQNTSTIRWNFDTATTFYTLCNNPHPQEVDIEKYLATEGFQQLLLYLEKNWGTNYNQNLYRNILLHIFLPEKYPKTQQIESYSWLIKYFQKYRKNPNAISAYLDTIKPVLESKIVLEKVFLYVPKTTKSKEVPVYFVVGVNQGCASNSGVFIDNYKPTTASKAKKYLLPWVAHEAHHFFRSQFDGEEKEFEEKHPKLSQAMYWLETEGIAERVGALEYDLDKYLKNNPKRSTVYKQFPAQMNQLQEAILRYSKDFKNGEELLQILQPNNKPNIYHQMGNRMAFLIEEHRGRDILISLLGKPFSFFEAYQEVARELNQHHRFPFLSAKNWKFIKDKVY